MGFENHVDGNVVVLDESRRPHLKRGGILRYLTPVLVVMKRVEEDKVEVVKRVERVLVLVLGKSRLHTVDAAGLRNNLSQQTMVERSMRLCRENRDLVILRPGLPIHEVHEHVRETPFSAAAGRARNGPDHFLDGRLLSS